MRMSVTHRKAEYDGTQVPPSRLPVTAEGLNELVAEIHCLGIMREEALAELPTTDESELGRRGRSRSDEVMALDREIEGLRRAVVDSTRVTGSNPPVAVGTRVTLVDDEGVRELALVGPMEANPLLGRISYSSPLARAILGRWVGDEVDLVSSEGVNRLKIVAVSPMSNDVS